MKLRLRVLNGDDLRQIHHATLRILSGVGILVMDDDTRKRLKDHGCREGDDGYLLFHEEVVRDALATVPPRMILYNRNNEIVIDTDAARPQFSSGVNCINFLDYKTGAYRPCILADIRKATRVCDRLKHIDLVGSLGTPPQYSSSGGSTRHRANHARTDCQTGHVHGP